MRSQDGLGPFRTTPGLRNPYPSDGAGQPLVPARSRRLPGLVEVGSHERFRISQDPPTRGISKIRRCDHFFAEMGIFVAFLRLFFRKPSIIS